MGNLHADQVSLKNTTLYADQQLGYWSVQQRDVSPACFVQPTCADEVSTIIQIARLTKCPFAIKSGGHAAFAGSSSVEGGITILLNRMTEIIISDDKKVTRIGPGNRWIDVYETLQPHNLSVIGGRVAEIGVGGLTLGGGISFFSGRRGWACDNVVNYEVVTADGEILEVNHQSYPDLYWALRGGGNNFGVVTRLDLETFPQGDIWGGSFVSTMEYNATLLDALSHFADNAPEDVDAGTWVAFAYANGMEDWIISTELTQAKGVVDPPILREFTAVPNVHSTLRLTNMTSLAYELNASNPNGLEETFWTATFKNSRPLMQDILDIYKEEIKPFEEVTGVVAALILSPIARDVIKHFGKNGGNCLGIHPDDGPFILLNLATMWLDTSYDEALLATHKRIVDRCVARAKELDAYVPFLYQNYAAKDQEVFASYGQENLQRLIDISKKYDPQQVFQKLQPGYFKLGEV